MRRASGSLDYVSVLRARLREHGSADELSQQLQEGICEGDADCLKAAKRIAGDSLRSNRWLASQPAIVGELVQLARVAENWQAAREAADAMVVLATSAEGRAALRVQNAPQALLRLVVAATDTRVDGSSSGSSEDSGSTGSSDDDDDVDVQRSICWRPPTGWSDCVDTLNRLQLEEHGAHAAEPLTDITLGEKQRLAEYHLRIRCPIRRHRVAVLLALLAAEAPERLGPSPMPSGAVDAAVGTICDRAFWDDSWERAPCHGSLLDSGRPVVDALQRCFSMHSENGMRAWLSEGHPSVGSMPWCDAALLRGASLVQPCLWRHQEPGAGPRALPMQLGEDYRMVRASAASGEHEFSDTVAGHPVSIGDEAMRGYARGYSLVVNSLQLRHDGCAALAAALARQICERPETGVVHVGVNLYATPPGEQGLVPHYDDHSVFVIQLEGQKHWTLWPESCGATLPRLRDERATPQLSAAAALHYVLQPGDWLFIPRGWPHVAAVDGTASTGASRSSATGGAAGSGSAEYQLETGSVHLSLSVDLERPFDMAGALHIALRHFCLQRPIDGGAERDTARERAKDRHADRDTEAARHGSAKRQRTEDDISPTTRCLQRGTESETERQTDCFGRRWCSSAECWLHAHIDLARPARNFPLSHSVSHTNSMSRCGTGGLRAAKRPATAQRVLPTVGGARHGR